MMARMPAAEVNVRPSLVRSLLADQHPDLAHLPVSIAANGWDNTMVRIGPRLVARLPRRQAAASLVEHEQAVLPRIAPRLPLPVPVPVRTGLATGYYPWRWSIAPWLAGTSAVRAPARERDRWAPALADFLIALHRVADADAPANSVRGVPLAQRADAVRSRMAPGTFGRSAELRVVFDQGVAAPVYEGPPMWLHGDLHPLNLLTDQGRLCAVVDFGDVTAGDPATDLATAWLTFSTTGRQLLVERYSRATGAPASLWLRARAWAAVLVSALLNASDDHEDLLAIGEHGLRELLDAPDVP